MTWNEGVWGTSRTNELRAPCLERWRAAAVQAKFRHDSPSSSAKEQPMPSRRELLSYAAGGATGLYFSSLLRKLPAVEPTGVLLNDVQSQLNPTRVKAVTRPQSVKELE